MYNQNKMNDKQILAIIPSYNPGKQVVKVIQEIKEYIPDILVVDDGSTDGSSEAIQQIKDIRYIRHKENRGKGAALKTGFSIALAENYDSVLTIDADYQHLPEDILKFLNVYHDHDLIIGSRMHNVRNMPLQRVLANRIASYLVSKKCKQNISDSQSGYRLIKTNILKHMELKRDDYQIETEILLKAAKNEHKIGEVKISTQYNEEVSHINPFLITLSFFQTLFSK